MLANYPRLGGWGNNKNLPTPNNDLLATLCSQCASADELVQGPVGRLCLLGRTAKPQRPSRLGRATKACRNADPQRKKYREKGIQISTARWNASPHSHPYRRRGCTAACSNCRGKGARVRSPYDCDRLGRRGRLNVGDPTSALQCTARAQPGAARQ